MKQNLKFLIPISILTCYTTLSAQNKDSFTAVMQNSEQASSYTRKINDALKTYLPLADSTDFYNATKGFIGTLSTGEIRDLTGNLNYSMKEFDFLKKDAPATANPSLWRQSRLNAINGLFKVTDNIYQIRGFDLANMTLVKGKSGWIVIDPLTAKETAAAGMELVKKLIGNYPVSAVILTHSHLDHFGGMHAVVNEEDLKSGKIKVYAPEGFFEHSISENVLGGNTMSRRAGYMYGNLVPKNEIGSLGSGLGTTTARGTTGILEPSDYISDENGETKVIDGVKIEFYYTPESEAPAEMMFYFPDFKALCQAENISHTLHNLYTLRGAQVRNGLKWSKYIDHSIRKFGGDVEVSFGTHHWPVWGNKDIVKFWENQRDMYRFIHDQTLRLANQGYTPLEIAEMLKLPEALDKEFYNRGYYGTVSHNVKAQYQLYFGWFDGNPSNLNPLPPDQVGMKYIEYMGGEKKVLELAKKSFDNGEYRWVAEVLKHVVFTNPNNQIAKDLLADTYQQMAYTAESAPWRNFYLSGALELKHGKPNITAETSTSPDMINGMSSSLFFDYIAMRYKGSEQSKDRFNFNLTLTDRNEKIGIIVENGVVTPRVNEWIKGNTTADITVSRKDLAILTNISLDNFENFIKEGKLVINGDKASFKKFLNDLDKFDPWFNIVEP